MQLYRGILKQALDITWKSKYLWFFGLFAALLGNGGEYEILFQPFSNDSAPSMLSGFEKLAQTGLFSMQGLKGIGNLLVTQPISVIVAILVLVIIFALLAFVVWLVNVSQAVLVKNTLLKISDKQLKFKDSLYEGMKKFWPVFGFNLVARIIVMISLAIVGYIVFFSNDLGSVASALIYILMFLVFIPLAMSFSFIVKYSIGYSVINNEKFLDAFNSGWSLFKKNWLVSLEMAFILYFLNIVAALLFIVVALIVALPFAFLAFLATSVSMMGMFLFIVSVGVILFIALLITTGSLVATFQVSAWTTLYIELIGRGAKSKIVRMFSK